MKKLKSTSDIIRATGSVREPYVDGPTAMLEWLNNLPYNEDAGETDYGIYITVQGNFTLEQSDAPITLLFPHFEIYRKLTDKNGNPCFQIRDVNGFVGSVWTNYGDAEWLWYDNVNGCIALTEIDPTV